MTSLPLTNQSLVNVARLVNRKPQSLNFLLFSGRKLETCNNYSLNHLINCLYNVYAREIMLQAYIEKISDSKNLSDKIEFAIMQDSQNQFELEINFSKCESRCLLI